MILLVTGGRRYADRERLYAELDRVHAERRIRTLVQGGASGADMLAIEWCAHRAVKCQTFAASWSKLGRAAGPMRNQEMVDEVSRIGSHIGALCLAFPGGSGTADCIRRARSAGIRVVEVAAEEKK